MKYFRLAGIVVLIGCTQTGEHCTRICAKLELCDSATDELDCREACLADRSLSDAAWTAYDTCYAELSCSHLGASAELLDCLTDELRATPPTATVTGLCRTMATQLDACDNGIDESATENNCLAGTRAYSDAYASSLEACYSQPCDQIGTCLNRSADDFDMTNGPGVYTPVTAPGAVSCRDICTRVGVACGDVFDGGTITPWLNTSPERCRSDCAAFDTHSLNSGCSAERLAWLACSEPYLVSCAGNDDPCASEYQLGDECLRRFCAANPTTPWCS